MLFLLSRDHGRPARAVRKSAIRVKGHSGMSETIHARPAKPTPRALRSTYCRRISKWRSKPYSQSRAYMAAGYTARDGDRNHRSAQASSSRLLSKVIQQVRELQHIAAMNAAETAEKMARELNEIQHEARADKAHAAAVSAVLGKAKVLNITVEKHEIVNSNAPQNSNDIAIALLADVGLHEPDEDAKQRALQAYDTMVATLEEIASEAMH